jgi:putative aldouronate transport system substrate-binding protein
LFFGFLEFAVFDRDYFVGGRKMKSKTSLNSKLAAILAAALLVAAQGSLFAGARNERTVPADNFNPAGLPIVKQPITLNAGIWLNANMPTDVNNSPYWQMVEKETGIHIEWDVYQGDEVVQKKNLMFASGSYPDLMLLVTNTDDEERYGVGEKVIIPVDEYINDQYMPTYYNLIKNYPDLVKQTKATDGKTYGVYNAVIYFNEMGNNHIAMQKKWLDKLGLQPPKTTAEFENVLRAFKTGDPNGNGRADELPFALNFVEQASDLWSFFGVLNNPNHLALENNKVSFPALDAPRYREAVEWISKLYREGLIDPEMLTDSIATTWAKVKQGNAGVFMAYRWHYMQYSYEGIWDDYMVLLPPAAPNAQPVWRGWIAGISADTNTTSITKTNKYVKETIRWIDYQMDPLIAAQGRRGPIGMIQEFNSEGKLVHKQKADGTMPTNEDESRLGSGRIWFFPEDLYNKYFILDEGLQERQAWYKQYKAAGYISKQAQNMLNFGRLTSAAEQQRRALLTTEIDKFMKENLVAFFQNGVTDSSWQTFQNNLRSLGAAEYVSLYQKTFDLFNR